MNVQPQFGSDEERAARRLIEQAGTILKGLRGGIPDSFAAVMFAGATPEDLVRYEAREIADLAEAAWLFLQERKAGDRRRCASRRGPARWAPSASRRSRSSRCSTPTCRSCSTR